MSFSKSIRKQLESVVTDGENLDESQKFLRFVIDLVLREHEVSYEFLIDGITDGSDDNGVDAIYVSVDGEIIEDLESSDFERAREVEIYLIQATTGNSATTTDIRKFRDGVKDIFYTDKKLSGNKAFEENGKNVRDVIDKWIMFGNKKLQVHVLLFFITLSEKQQDARAIKEMEEICTVIKDRYRDFKYSSELYGARDLFDIALYRPNQKMLKTQAKMDHDSDISGILSYFFIVNGSDFFEFLKEDKGKGGDEVIDDSVFEKNVRDYLGRKRVNKEIQETIGSEERRKNFLYMNNGITIIAKKVKSTGHKHILEDYQIINGCQTSYTFWEEIKKNRDIGKKIEVSIKVVETEDEKAVADIIRATNRQTAISEYDLSSLNKIHLLIEDKLKEDKYFYERRKNYYTRMKKPRNSIISIQGLFQVLISICGRDPMVAKGGPKKAFETSGEKMFSEKNKIEYYSIAARLYFFFIIPIRDYELKDGKKLYWNRNNKLSLGKPVEEECEKELDIKSETIKTILRVASFYFVQGVFILLVFKATGEKIEENINMEREASFISEKNYQNVMDVIKKSTMYSQDVESIIAMLIESISKYDYEYQKKTKPETTNDITPHFPILESRAEITAILKKESFQKMWLQKLQEM